MSKGATLRELGAVWTVLRDLERDTDDQVAMQRLIVMVVLTKVGLSDTFVPIIVSRMAEELGTSRSTVRAAMDSVSGELLEFEVTGNESGKGRRVNRARATEWLRNRVDEILQDDEEG